MLHVIDPLAAEMVRQHKVAETEILEVFKHCCSSGCY